MGVDLPPPPPEAYQEDDTHQPAKSRSMKVLEDQMDRGGILCFYSMLKQGCQNKLATCAFHQLLRMRQLL